MTLKTGDTYCVLIDDGVCRTSTYHSTIVVFISLEILSERTVLAVIAIGNATTTESFYDHARYGSRIK